MIYNCEHKAEEYRAKMMIRYHLAAYKTVCEAEKAEMEKRIRKLEMQMGMKRWHFVDLEV